MTFRLLDSAEPCERLDEIGIQPEPIRAQKAAVDDGGHRRLEPFDRGGRVASPECPEPERSPCTDAVVVVTAGVGHRERRLRVREGLGPSEHPLDQGQPGEAGGDTHVVAERRQVEAFQLERVRTRQATGPRLDLRELVECVVEDPGRFRFSRAFDHAFEQLARDLVVLEVEKDVGDIDRDHAARVDPVEEPVDERERLLALPGKSLHPREVLKEVERCLGRRIVGRAERPRALRRRQRCRDLEATRQDSHDAGQDEGCFRRRGALRFADADPVRLVELGAVEQQVRPSCNRPRSQLRVACQLGDVGEQALCVLEPAGRLCGEGSLQKTARAPLDVGRQQRRLLERPRFRRDAAAAASRGGRLLECPRDVVVGATRRRGAVPCATVRLGCDRRQGGVRGPPISRRRCPVDRRPRERVTEVESLPSGEAPPPVPRRSVSSSRPRRRERLHEGVGVAWISGCDQQERILGLAREGGRPRKKGPLDLGADRQPLVERSPPRAMLRAERSRNLQEGERVPVRELDESGRRAVREVRRGQAAISSLRLGNGEALAKLSSPRPGAANRGTFMLPRREQHHDLLGMEAAGDERQRLGGGSVEPLRVVDDTEERLLVGRHGEQAENRERDGQSLLCGPVLDRERLFAERAPAAAAAPDAASMTGRTSCCTPAKASSASDSTPRARRT